MVFEMMRFEWRYQIRQASFYVAGSLLFIAAFLITAVNRVSMGGANLFKNGVYTTTLVSLVFSIFGMFLAATFMSQTATRNHSSNMAGLLYCKPIPAARYQIGRFLGAFAVVVTLFAAVPLGLFSGTLMPWVDPARLGPLNPAVYLTTFTAVSVPTLFGFSCLFYVLALRFRSVMAVNLAALVLLIGYEIGNDLLTSPDQRVTAALLDPFGMTAFMEVTRYWTIFDKNNLSLPLDGLLLWNRLIWVGLGLAATLLFGRLHQPLRLHPPKKAKPKRRRQQADTPPQGTTITIPIQPGRNGLKLVTSIWFEVRQVLGASSFRLLIPLAVTLLLGILFSPTNVYEIYKWPLTMTMVDTIRFGLQTFAIVIITFYSAEIVWRERGAGIGDIVDSMPVPNAVFWVAKLVAAWLVLLVILAIGMLVTILTQLGAGHQHLDLPQYLTTLSLFSALPWMMLTVAAFLLQVLCPNKYAGMFAFVALLGCGFGLNLAGFGNNLLLFSTSPGLTSSDLNGYGWFLETHAWYMLYWGALATAMAFAGYALWQRGPRKGLRTRLRGFLGNLGRGGQIVSSAACVVFLATGLFIYTNTRVRNEHNSAAQEEAEQIAYEKAFAKYIAAPVPEITKVDVTVEIFPEQRRLLADAELVLVNKSHQPINRFLVAKPEYTQAFTVEIAGGALNETAGPGNTYWFEFMQPLQPGEERRGRMTVERGRQGFREGNEDTTVVGNGTFISNLELFPSFGYQVDFQITDAVTRKRHDLPPPHRANKLHDERFHNQTFLGPGNGFIDFEAKIATAADQIAVAPGYLQNEWRDGERRWFHYKMDAPMLNFYAFTSARLEVTRDNHKGVNIEIYHHAQHAMNVARMVQSTKDTLDYMTQHFGPYQHRQLRIIEFPRYRNYAQSFANTVPYSELGFISDLRDPLKVDTAYNTTAHEVAHQWWGHQLVGANVQGGAVLSETLAQYSELMVMKENLGLMSVRRALKVELDLYLRGRTREVFEEQPLLLTENQNYIHYNKGSLVMMALHGLLGEARLNGAIKSLLEEHRFAKGPYPTSLDLQKHLNQVADAGEQAVIADLFERIILYDLKMTAATVTPRVDGRYDVRLELDAARFEADGQGRENEIDLDETVEIALFNKDPDTMADDTGILYLARHRVTAGTNTLALVVDQKPSHAGIDPLLRFIDRDHDDNVMPVETEAADDEPEVTQTTGQTAKPHAKPLP